MSALISDKAYLLSKQHSNYLLDKMWHNPENKMPGGVINPVEREQKRGELLWLAIAGSGLGGCDVNTQTSSAGVPTKLVLS